MTKFTAILHYLTFMFSVQILCVNMTKVVIYESAKIWAVYFLFVV